MRLDEAALREWVHRVTHGMADRRTFLRAMTGLGLSGPFLGNLLATYRPAQAQTIQPMADVVPTRRGGGGKLRLLWWQAPTILNSHLSSGTKDVDASRVVYKPLAAFDPEANFVPILAADIPSLDNGGLAKDGTSVTWKLKQGVVWHDGQPFTADDVVFTWAFAADSATGATTTGSYTTSITSTSSMRTPSRWSSKSLRPSGMMPSLAAAGISYQSICLRRTRGKRPAMRHTTSSQ